MRIALREARRAQARWRPEPPQAGTEEEASSDPTPEARTARSEEARALALLIAGLSEEKRISLLLFEVEGYSVQEIADVLGEPRGTVLARLSRTRAELQRALSTRLGTEDAPGARVRRSTGE